jgi:MFS transporter, ACS family, solute carrier family 17 (sodium-dependent inorganic phosphate cotransporter), other
LCALLLCYIDRTIISVAAIEMQKELGWSDSQKGFVLSVFSAGYLLMQLLGGLLSNRFGGRNVYLFCVFLWSLTTVLTPMAAYASFAALIVARVALGLGEGATYPASYNLIDSWMPLEERSRSVGLISSAAAAGTVGALLVTGKLIESLGWPFLFGGIGFAWCLLWLRIIPARSPADDTREQQDGSTVRPKIPWKILLTHPSVLTLYVVNFGGQSITFLMAAWLPSYFVDTFGASTTEAGMYAILPWLVLSIATYAAGHYTDKRIDAGEESLALRKRLLRYGFMLVILSLAAMTLGSTLGLSIFLVLLIFSGVGILIPVFSTIPSEILPRHSDVLFGFLCAVGALGSLIFVSGAGILLDMTGSYNATFLAVAAACLVSVTTFQVYGSTTRIVDV